MVGNSIGNRIAGQEKPDEISDVEEIWATVKAVLVIVRVLLFIAIIAVSEIMEEYRFLQLSLAIWSLVIGIPLFLLLSAIIIFGDKRFGPNANPDDDEADSESSPALSHRYDQGPTTVKYPIRKRQ